MCMARFLIPPSSTTEDAAGVATAAWLESALEESCWDVDSKSVADYLVS